MPDQGELLGAAILALTVGLIGLHVATPVPGLPVGTAIAEPTGSMGAEGERLLIYVDRSPSIGETVVFYPWRSDVGHRIHHRVVGRTPTGWLTQGDAVPKTDQALGMPAVEREEILGTVEVSLPLPTWIRLSGLSAALMSLSLSGAAAVGVVPRSG